MAAFGRSETLARMLNEGLVYVAKEPVERSGVK
jgi:hypothetical protein